MPTRSTTAARAGGLVLTAALLTGCFSPSAEDGAAAGSAGEDGSDGRISIAMLQPPRSGLSPLSDDAFKLSRWSTGETLVVLDEAGDAQPGLATAWEQVEPTTWRFEVRPDVTFHDGTALTPEDVVRSLTAAAEAVPPPRILDGVDLTAEVDPGAPDSAVLVTTAEPDPLVPQRMSSPQLTVLAASAYADGVVDPVGTGTGPYELTVRDGTSGATLERYDDYWGETASAAGLDVTYVSDGTARAAALRTGTADVVEAIPVSQASLLEEDQIEEVPMPRTNTLYLNTETGVFADPAVRAAAREAIDRQTIVDTVYEGRADVAEGLLGPALPWAAQGRPDRTPTPAGTVPPGTPITLGTFTDRAELPEVAVQLEQQLEAAGFDVTQEVREYAQIEADALSGAFDAFILSRATVLDSGDPVAYMYSDFACEGSFNISQLCDPEVDAALEEAAQTPPGEERRAAALEAERLVLEADAGIPMLHERVIQGESDRLAGAARDPRERALVTSETSVG
ncbi:ABC transporter substrate-binding protein [uncultured Pseudokineococcus sp.]|uniref:ABC transporter substrate-binding protein n=1 Tax=uncultured Pseudokineococcus sp. TaxID=1642928 RepID=UPI00260D91F4|nr:ABC transporter substrate-binding protein [uncultured Pseudokineococcus sp.]